MFGPGWDSALVLSAVALPVFLPQEIGTELVEAGAADLAHDQVDLAAEDVDRLLDAVETARDRAVQRRPAEEAEFRAEAHRDQDVGAAPHAAVEHDSQPVADRRDYRRQHVERGRGLVELARAVVRHDDAVAADLGTADRIGRAHDA